MEWHAQSAVVEPEDAAAKAAPEPDSAGWPSYLGWPSVKQQSSLFEFLEKILVAARAWRGRSAVSTMEIGRRARDRAPSSYRASLSS